MSGFRKFIEIKTYLIMKQLALLLSLVFISNFTLLGQNYNSPECIRWDPVNEQYLVSNVGGFILAVDPETQTRTEFANAGLTGPKGMVVVDGVVYVTDVTEVEGFLLSDGSHIFHLAVNGAAFLNGITTDTKGNLYAADTNLGKVFKIVIETKVVTTFATTGLTGINGVWLDQNENRLIAVFWRNNSPVSSISLEDGSVSTLLSTSFSNLDGITQDNCGDFYFSSWGSNSVYKVKSDFTEDAEVVLSNLNGPADIFFDQNTQQIWVPNFNSNSIRSEIAFLKCLTPMPHTPEDGSENQWSKNLEFAWEGVNHAKSYRIEISLTPIFADVILALGVGETSVTVESLDLNTTYYWRVSASNGGTYTDFSPVYTFKTEESSGVDNVNISRDLRVFPNPASSKIGLIWEQGSYRIQKIEILNISGQEVWSKNIEKSSPGYEYLDVSNWPRGVYFVKAITDNSILFHKKIIVR